MKKIIYLFLFTFIIGSSFTVTAKEEINADPMCTDLAWDYGTEMEGVWGQSAYWWTNLYYENNCL